MAQQIKLTDAEVKEIQTAHSLYEALTDIYKSSIDDKTVKAKILNDLSDAKTSFESAKDRIVGSKINANANWSLDYQTGIVTVEE